MHRIFLHNGKVTDRIDTYEDAGVLSDDTDAAQEVADALGVGVDEVTVEHVERAPAVDVTIPPAQSDTPASEPTLADKVAALEARLDAVSAYAGVPVEVMAAATPLTVVKG